MGFPFDRPIRDGVRTLTDFLTPNMAQTNIRVVHSDTVREGNLLAATAVPVGQINVPSGVPSIRSRISEINEIGG